MIFVQTRDAFFDEGLGVVAGKGAPGEVWLYRK